MKLGDRVYPVFLVISLLVQKQSIRSDLLSRQGELHELTLCTAILQHVFYFLMQKLMLDRIHSVRMFLNRKNITSINSMLKDTGTFGHIRIKVSICHGAASNSKERTEIEHTQRQVKALTIF